MHERSLGLRGSNAKGYKKNKIRLRKKRREISEVRSCMNRVEIGAAEDRARTCENGPLRFHMTEAGRTLRCSVARRSRASACTYLTA